MACIEAATHLGHKLVIPFVHFKTKTDVGCGCSLLGAPVPPRE